MVTTVLQPIAELLGVTVGQLIFMVIAGIVMVVGWYVLKAALKIASRVFAVGCFIIILVAGGLYLYFAFFR